MYPWPCVIYVFITRLAAELTSTVCQGVNTRFIEFLVYDRNGQTRYNWTAATKLCEANNASLPTIIGFPRKSFNTTCISDLLHSFPTLRTESLYLWRPVCISSVQYCSAYTFSILNNSISDGTYPQESKFGPSDIVLPVCEKGEYFY